MRLFGLITAMVLRWMTAAGQVFPDNMDSVPCSTDALQQPWDARVMGTVNDIHCYFVPIVGDIDGDGIVEIVAAKVRNNDYLVTELGIFRGTDLQLLNTINIAETHAGFIGPIAIVRYPDGNGNMIGAVVTHCYDNMLRSYSIDGQLLSVSDVGTPCDGAVSVTDFNYDGWPEVYIGNAVYDAATLRRLCAGPENGNMGKCWRSDNSQTGRCSLSFAADILGSSFPELICGNSIYSVNIASRTDVSQNSVNLVKTINIPNRIPQDGNVSVADFNLDGQLDVLVTVDGTPNNILDTSYFYAYDPATEDILFIHSHYSKTVGYPFVGDIDGDGFLEFVYIDYQTPVNNSRITAMGYGPVTGLQTQWQATHGDESGQTSMTLFDFNHDGIMEIVYRDQARLRIINGSGRSHITSNDTMPFYDLYSIDMYAGTWTEYPIVADVNDDGHAEIVTCGRMTTGIGYVGGQLVVVGGIHPWAPARPVWNQYLYNVTNINRNLTVPAPLFNNATSFTGPDNIVRRPFNNFLQQGTQLDQYGRPFFPGSEIELEYTASLCMGESYIDDFFSISSDTLSVGEYEFQRVIEHEDECDSIITLHLTLSEPSSSEMTDTICRGQGYHQHGFHIPESSTLNGGELTESLVLHNQAGCDSIVTLRLTLLDGELHILPPTEDFCKSYSAQLAVATSLDRIRWSTGEETQEIVVTRPGTYSIEAISGHCTAADAITIAACNFDLFLPNAITPSKDEGTNDYFSLPEQTARQLEEFEIHIYNRWGGLVYHSTTPYFRWDGTENGKLFPNNIYSYVILCKPVGHTRFIRTGTIVVL